MGAAKPVHNRRDKPEIAQRPAAKLQRVDQSNARRANATGMPGANHGDPMGDLLEMPGRTQGKPRTDPLGVVTDALDFVRDEENGVRAAVIVTIDDAGVPTYWITEGAVSTALLGAIEIVKTSVLAQLVSE